jgi:hypothetical protein
VILQQLALDMDLALMDYVIVILDSLMLIVLDLLFSVKQDHALMEELVLKIQTDHMMQHLKCISTLSHVIALQQTSLDQLVHS